MRKFDTAGPVRAERHYQIAPLSRIDLEEVLARALERTWHTVFRRTPSGDGVPVTVWGWRAKPDFRSRSFDRTVEMREMERD